MSHYGRFGWVVGPMAAALLFGACGDDGGTLYDLTVIETVPVEFGAMDGGAPEAAVVPLADLTSEPAYVEARDSLRCVGVDLAESAIIVDALDVGQFATPLIYTVSAGTRGASSFRTVATFSGPIAEGQRIRFSDSSFQVDPAGVAFIEETLLGASPALDLEVRGEVPGRIDDLVVTLTLTLKFSSTASDCP
jgi:hypothetical protein